MTAMTSLQRVLATLGGHEPDRVPLFLLLTMHGARELGLSIREYFSRAGHVAEGQLRLREKYGNDCLYAFFYAPLEIEAMGGEVIFVEDGPPNSGRPLIRAPEQIPDLRWPTVAEAPVLQRVLAAIALMKSRIGDEAPIIGVVMSPFSLPVMQLGFDRYFELIYRRRELFDALMRINEAFCVDWANAQIRAGATAICYFDPVSSPTIVPRELFLETGLPVAKRTIARIEGPTAVHLASGRALPILNDLAGTGAAIVGVSVLEDLAALKSASGGRVSLLGNLNGVEMRRWTPLQAEEKVKEAIGKGGRGGRYILADNHGEIPFQVPEEVLLAVAAAVRRWGSYPLDRAHG